MSKEPKYSFCEHVTCGYIRPRWHIREVGPEGLKLGGGATQPLCYAEDEDREWLNGWDLDVDFSIEEGSDAVVCSRCKEIYTLLENK